MPASQTATTPEQLLGQIRDALAALADPARAAPMRAYMRDRFPFLGIRTPVRRAALRPLLKVDFDQKSLLTVAGLLSLSACNTIQGIGKDIEKGGEAIQRATK